METQIAKKGPHSRRGWTAPARALLSLLPLLLPLSAASAQAETPEAEEAPAIQRPERDDGPSLKLIRNFLTVTGGKQAHNDLQNVVATGTINEAGRTRTFELIETRDGRRRITYEWTVRGLPHKAEYAFDGVTTWSRELLPRERPANVWNGADAIHFKRQRWLIQPFVLPLRADYVFAYQGAARVAGRPAHLIVGYGKNNERSWFYFDKEKFLLTRWGGLGAVAGTREHLDYRAYRFINVDGVLLPGQIDLLVENSAFGSISFDTIKANQPIDLKAFYQPPDTLPTLRQRPAKRRTD